MGLAVHRFPGDPQQLKFFQDRNRTLGVGHPDRGGAANETGPERDDLGHRATDPLPGVSNSSVDPCSGLRSGPTDTLG